ncbi:MAG TPA: hypothetical protein P5548_04655 [Candidatus Moranbacteria bacterium]|nr:hypothetical protein [Candidatus Moranbacteria bacterium]HRZ34156.1 hypothetical protein [Candidatus Moranbacteria bacterium]
MFNNSENSVSSFQDIITQLYASPLVFFLKIFFGIYLAVLIANVIMLLILRDVPAQLRVGLKGMSVPLVTKKKMGKRWDEVMKRLKSNEASQFKVAIIEADSIADGILSELGYKGANMMEKLEQVGTSHLDDHLEALKGAHQLRNRVVNEPDFEVDERLAKAEIGIYENFLRYLELLN